MEIIFESVPQEVVDEISASILDITFNHLRTVKIYGVLLEEVDMWLIKVLLAKSAALVKMIVMPPDEQGLSLPSPDRLSNLDIHLIDDILTLRHLYLKECEIQLPCFFKGFNKLIRLILKSVTLSSDTFESLISYCPLLEDLVLKDIDNPYFMSINAPKLRSFVFRGDIQLIHLENVPVLSNVLYAPRELVLEDEDDFVNIFSSIPSLECFSWDHFEVDNGSTKVIPTRLPSVLNCLKRLFMSWITLGEFFELSFALFIIRSSPNFEEIEIKECILSDGDYFESVPQEVVDEIPASFSDITFKHLRTVKFYDVLLEEVEMHLIKVLLAKSPALVKMVIKPHQMETNKSLNVLAEIKKFQRASSKAEVVYLVD
ncbi:F-box/FBD/LRR-repeat protein At1g13570-like [Solanum pennellii]|uniref:F-box/FBD/LRR-repeat protein At1g13570-like n=1 Tax=Solanum pennellii TaxID=28526 RepID=A0ABM1GL33_SOLPN|nr:F-box/FBD/LRR-repeat protein At1g13570-like [Solanum pennellii]